MKTFKISFLFFYAVILIVLSLNSQFTFAQQSIDSLMYYSNLVQHPQKGVDQIKAYAYFKKDIKRALKENNPNRVIHDLFYISNIEYTLGAYGESENSAVEALTLLDGLIENDYSISLKKGLLNHLGMLYREQRNTEKALALYTDAIKIAKTVKDSIILFNNKSNIFKDISNYKAAKKRIA